MLKGEDLERWRAKNRRENEGYLIRPGDRITDCWRNTGTVRKVSIPSASRHSVQNHGSITVELDDDCEEHYAAWNWQDNFRIVRG